MVVTTRQNLPTISAALISATQQLTIISDAPHLDAEILLAHILSTTRSHLFAWPERQLTAAEVAQYSEQLARRLQGEPVAYLTGHKEFWSLDLVVTPDTLIPRPETELLVELLLEKFDQDDSRIVADLGTGSGAIALALAHERPNWILHATDVMSAALQVAASNAERLRLSNVKFHLGAWCAALPHTRFDAIVSNPPYIAIGDPGLQATVLNSEPVSALLSGSDGLDDIRQIIQTAKKYLRPGGCLLLEHGFQQGAEVRKLYEQAGYQDVTTHHDLVGLQRVTMASYAAG